MQITSPRALATSSNFDKSNRRSLAILLSVILIALVARFPAASLAASKAVPADARAEKIARSVTIYRDTYGVPHIFGPTDASCVFGYIYAQAEDNFWQIEDS